MEVIQISTTNSYLELDYKNQFTNATQFSIDPSYQRLAVVFEKIENFLYIFSYQDVLNYNLFNYNKFGKITFSFFLNQCYVTLLSIIEITGNSIHSIFWSEHIPYKYLFLIMNDGKLIIYQHIIQSNTNIIPNTNLTEKWEVSYSKKLLSFSNNHLQNVNFFNIFSSSVDLKKYVIYSLDIFSNINKEIIKIDNSGNSSKCFSVYKNDDKKKQKKFSFLSMTVSYNNKLLYLLSTNYYLYVFEEKNVKKKIYLYFNYKINFQDEVMKYKFEDENNQMKPKSKNRSHSSNTKNHFFNENSELLENEIKPDTKLKDFYKSYKNYNIFDEADKENILEIIDELQLEYKEKYSTKTTKQSINDITLEITNEIFNIIDDSDKIIELDAIQTNELPMIKLLNDEKFLIIKLYNINTELYYLYKVNLEKCNSSKLNKDKVILSTDNLITNLIKSKENFVFELSNSNYIMVEKMKQYNNHKITYDKLMTTIDSSLKAGIYRINKPFVILFDGFLSFLDLDNGSIYKKQKIRVPKNVKDIKVIWNNNIILISSEYGMFDIIRYYNEIPVMGVLWDI